MVSGLNLSTITILFWVAVEEFSLNCHNMDTVLFGIYLYLDIYIYIIWFSCHIVDGYIYVYTYIMNNMVSGLRQLSFSF